MKTQEHHIEIPLKTRFANSGIIKLENGTTMHYEFISKKPCYGTRSDIAIACGIAESSIDTVVDYDVFQVMV